MGTLNTKLTLTSTDLLSDTLSLTLTDAFTIAGNIKIRRITTSDTAAEIPGIPDGIGRSILYLKNLDASIDIKIYLDGDDGGDADAGEELMDMKPGEWAIMPYSGVKALWYDADSGTPVLEYGLFSIA